ncbi:MAG: hypothetical protein H8E46_05950 [FCB group bacterium]|nr:hypothetical protein [FCB group bacterium]
MRCSCGSTSFVPLGIQQTMIAESSDDPGQSIHLINCSQCGTTLSCSKHFYSVVKYLDNYNSTKQDSYRLAH